MAEFIEQGSLDWHRQRLGCFNGSELGDLMTASRTKGEVFGQSALSLIAKVAAERQFNPKILENDLLFNSFLDQTIVTNRYMDWGKENEQNARKLYEKITGFVIDECESIPHPTIPYFRSSPDGFCCQGGQRSCLEIKCMGINNYGKYLMNLTDAESLKKLNSTYYWQCFAHMAVTGATFTDFFVYCPWLKKPYTMLRIERDEEIINQLEERVKLANEYIEQHLG